MKKFIISTIAITLLIPFKSVNAEPNSCKISAITVQEIEAVDILQKMSYLQSEIRIKGEKLDKLNYQKSKGYDSYNENSVNKYNKLIAQYNDIVSQKNDLGEQYNQLKDIFNAQVEKISPSTNTNFVMCLNTALLRVETNTTSLNIDSLKTTTETLKTNTEDLTRRTENLTNNTDILKANTENLTRSAETLKINTENFQLNLENLEDYEEYTIFKQLN